MRNAVTFRPSRLPLFGLFLFPLLTGCMSQADPSSPYSAQTPSEALLWQQPYPSIYVQFDYVPGYAPSQIALDAFEQNLRTATLKDNVSMVVREINTSLVGDTSSHRAWTEDEARRLDVETFAFDSRWLGEKGTAYIHVLYLNGDPVDTLADVVAVAIKNKILMFPDHMAEPGAAGLNGHTQIERQILVHELGHVLGLVNSGIPMVHAREDLRFPHHSSELDSPVCVCDEEPRRVAPLLGGANESFSPPFRFNEHDMEDIIAFREKDPSRQTPRCTLSNSCI